MDSQFAHEGCLLLPQVFSSEDVQDLISSLTSSLTAETESVRTRNENVYAARNLLSLWPRALTVWRKPVLVDFLTQVLGEDFGLVRGLYFDKPPDQTWALPWHKDLLIAVKRESVKSSLYSRPRDRAGTPHVEPPVEVLQSMATLRIHLDEMTSENGPLEVLPGSHITGKKLIINEFQPWQVLGQAGDVFAMRPLLVHSSGRSVEGTTRHRRIVHLEFSGMRALPDSAQWDTFVSH